jgi:hypothetical protein
MSRTRQKPNEIDLWVFYQQTTDTNNHIENTYNAIGEQFRAEDLGTKTRNERDILSGRVYKSGTVQVYRTMNEIELNIGDKIATVENPSEFDFSSIVNIKTKPQNQRGARLNTKRVVETTIEVS